MRCAHFVGNKNKEKDNEYNADSLIKNIADSVYQNSNRAL